MTGDQWMICYVVLVFSLAAALGCSSTTPAPSVSSDPVLAKVCEITSEQMGVNASRVTGQTSLADLGADELDVVELVMELEDEFKITIPDDAIAKVSGNDKSEIDAKKLTMAKLAEIVRGAKK
jgi:acyl carrier protein